MRDTERFDKARSLLDAFIGDVELRSNLARAITQHKVTDSLLERYPKKHSIQSNAQLLQFGIELKSRYMKKIKRPGTIRYDGKVSIGQATSRAFLQGSRITRKKEILIASPMRNTPEHFLEHVLVHELAHLKYPDHNKEFWRLCEHMQAEYHSVGMELMLWTVTEAVNGTVWD